MNADSTITNNILLSSSEISVSTEIHFAGGYAGGWQMHTIPFDFKVDELYTSETEQVKQSLNLLQPMALLEVTSTLNLDSAYNELSSIVIQLLSNLEI